MSRRGFTWLEGQEPSSTLERSTEDDGLVFDPSEAPAHKIRMLGPGERNIQRLYVKVYDLNQVGGTFTRHFARIILDEAYMAKADEGAFVNYLRLERFDAVHFIMATPVVSTARDLGNVLEIAWQCMGMEDVFQHIRQPLKFSRLYKVDYDPVAAGRIFHGPSRVRGHERVVDFVRGKDWSSEFPIWVLHPDWFKAAGNEMDWGDVFSSLVVARILSVFQRRRAITTPLALPDGSMAFPGTGVPEVRITTEELSLVGHEARDLAEFSKEMKDNVGGPSEERTYTMIPGGQVRSAAGKPMLKNSNYHQGSLASFDFRNKMMLESAGDGAQMVLSVGFANLLVEADTDGGLYM